MLDDKVVDYGEFGTMIIDTNSVISKSAMDAILAEVKRSKSHAEAIFKLHENSQARNEAREIVMSLSSVLARLSPLGSK